MANSKPKRRIKPVETVRQKAEKASIEKPKKARRIRSAAGKVGRPILNTAGKVSVKEYHPLTLPDNKVGRVFNHRVRFMPKFFRAAWQELRQVTWPSRRETGKLTLAVITFAIVFGFMIAVVDYGLDKLFKEVLIK